MFEVSVLTIRGRPCLLFEGGHVHCLREAVFRCRLVEHLF
jgi:hypothetical protein